MLDMDMLLTMTESEVENTNLFPFPPSMHLIFAAVALIFFLYRFASDKKPYQAIMAVAIPFSLTIWLSDNRTWFYIVGAIELVAIIAALISTFIFKDKSQEEAPAGSGETAPEAEEAEDAPEETPEADDVPETEDTGAEEAVVQEDEE